MSVNGQDDAIARAVLARFGHWDDDAAQSSIGVLNPENCAVVKGWVPQKDNPGVWTFENVPTSCTVLEKCLMIALMHESPIPARSANTRKTCLPRLKERYPRLFAKYADGSAICRASVFRNERISVAYAQFVVRLYWALCADAEVARASSSTGVYAAGAAADIAAEITNDVPTSHSSDGSDSSSSDDEDQAPALPEAARDLSAPTDSAPSRKRAAAEPSDGAGAAVPKRPRSASAIKGFADECRSLMLDIRALQKDTRRRTASIVDAMRERHAYAASENEVVRALYEVFVEKPDQ
jgi:hypothetical protein